VAIAVVVIGGFFALRSVTITEAERSTREQVRVDGSLVEAAGLSDGVLRGDPSALERLDKLVLGRVANRSVVRVKLWSRDGTLPLLRPTCADRPSLPPCGQRARAVPHRPRGGAAERSVKARDQV
jgi:hypothetical protein